MSSRVNTAGQVRGLLAHTSGSREATRRVILAACLRLESKGVEPSIVKVWEETGRTVGLSSVKSRKRHNDIVRERSRAFRIAQGLPVPPDETVAAAVDAVQQAREPDSLEDASSLLRQARREIAILSGQVKSLRDEADGFAKKATGFHQELKDARRRIEDLEGLLANFRNGFHERLPVLRGPRAISPSDE